MNTEIQSVINKGLSIKAVNDYIDNAAITEMKNTTGGYDKAMKQLMGNLNVADGTTNATATSGGLGTGGNTETTGVPGATAPTTPLTANTVW